VTRFIYKSCGTKGKHLGRHGSVMIEKDFWTNKRVFVTGHTGFKGSWLSLWLNSLGAIVKGYSLEPPTAPSLFNEARVFELICSEIGDIRDHKKLYNSMVSFKPDILIHMAAQPLVRYSYREPIETYETNVIGTAKVLEVARSCVNLKAIINITTDKCYKETGTNSSYKEEDPMGGHDPYSSSKACAELVASSYRDSFLKEQGIGIASVRAGNVIGGGDWAEDRLIPDILRSFEKDEKVVIRSPKAIRPWQHVLEPLSGYLFLAQKIYNDQECYAEGWNFGPSSDDIKPVDWILNKMTSHYPNSRWCLDVDSNPYESASLRLDISKARLKLGWAPTWKLEYTLKKIVNWHKAWIDKEDMQEICKLEINEFTKCMKP